MKTPVPGRNPCFERDVPRVSTEDFAQCISSGCTWKPSPFVSVPDHPPLHAPLQASLPHCAGRWPLQCPLEHLPSLQLPWDCLHFCYCLPEWAGTVCKSWYIAKYSVLRNHVEEDVSFSARYPGCLWWIGERNQHVIVLVENVYSGITQGSCTLIVLSALSVINRIPNAVKSTDRGPDVGTGPVYVSGQINITQIPTDAVKVTSLYILLPN